jgi:hypothetical protein
MWSLSINTLCGHTACGILELIVRFIIDNCYCFSFIWTTKQEAQTGGNLRLHGWAISWTLRWTARPCKHHVSYVRHADRIYCCSLQTLPKNVRSSKEESSRLRHSEVYSTGYQSARQTVNLSQSTRHVTSWLPEKKIIGMAIWLIGSSVQRHKDYF